MMPSPESQVPPDHVLATGREASEVEETQRNNLLRYLQRTERFGDPPSELLYLEPPGAAAGLKDAELGHFIELVAPDAPDDVVMRLLEPDLSSAELDACTYLLVELVDKEDGLERANLLEVVLRVTEERKDGASETVRHSVASCLLGFLNEQELDESLLAVGVSIGVSTAEQLPELLELIGSDSRTFEDSDRVQQIALMGDSLPEDLADTAYQHVVRLFQSDPEPMLAGLRSWNRAEATRLLRSHASEIQEGLHERVSADEEGAVDLARHLLAGPQDADIAAEVAWILLNAATAAFYDPIGDWADSHLENVSDSTLRDSVALKALSSAPAGDWRFWTSRLSGETPDWVDQGRRAAAALEHVVADFHEAEASEQEDLREAVAELIPSISALPSEELPSLVSVVEPILHSLDWWSSAEHQAAQERLHSGVRELRSLEEIEASVEDVLRTDIERSLLVPSYTVWTFNGIGQLGSKLGPESIMSLLEKISATETPTEGPVLAARLSACVDLATQTVDPLASLEQAGLSPPTLLDYLKGIKSSQSAATPAAQWLALDPPPDAVLTMARRFRRQLPTPLAKGVTDWARRRKRRERTDFILALAKQNPNAEAWTRAVAVHRVDSERVVRELRKLVRNATAAGTRRELVDVVGALDSVRGEAQKQCQGLMRDLLKTELRADAEIAIRLAPVLRDVPAPLERAIVGAIKRHGLKVTGPTANLLKQAGVQLPKESLTKRAIKLLFGRG